MRSRDSRDESDQRLIRPRMNSVRRPERLAALLALGLLAFLWLLFNGGAWLGLHRLRRMLEDELGTRLITTGQTVAATLGTRSFLILSIRDSTNHLDLDMIRSLRNDASYLELIALLARFKKAADLRSISLVTSDARVVADPDEPNLVGETRSLLFLDEQVIRRAAQGEPATSVLYPVGEVLYKRAYVPVRGEEGQVFALVRLEASSAYFEGLRQLGRTVGLLLVTSTAVLVLVAWVVYRLVNRLILTERAASQADQVHSLGALAAGLAHEIRNPLAIIRLTSEELRTALREGEANPPPPAPASTESGMAPAVPDTLIHDIQEEVQRLEELVEQFLLLARPEASPVALATGTPASPVAVTRQVTRLFEKSLRASHTRLKTELPTATIPCVFLNEKGMSQVLLNVLRNAAESIPSSGGTITVSLREHSGGGVELTVSDTGTGMSEGVRRQAFEPFFSTREGGTGLGLALVRRLVTAAAGEVGLDSQPGKGTTVRIYLPAATEKTRPGPERS